MSGHWRGDLEARCIDVLQSRRVDGLIVLTGRLSDSALRAVARSLPVVVTGRSLKAGKSDLAGLRQPRGCAPGHPAPDRAGPPAHRLHHAATPSTPTPSSGSRATDRRSKPPGCAVDPALVLPGNFTEHSGLAAVERLLDSRHALQRDLRCQRPDGVRCRPGPVPARHGACPTTSRWSASTTWPVRVFIVPPLTTVHNPIQEIGQLAGARDAASAGRRDAPRSRCRAAADRARVDARRHALAP